MIRVTGFRVAGYGLRVLSSRPATWNATKEHISSWFSVPCSSLRFLGYGPETCLLIPKTYNNENKKKLNIMKHMKRYTNEKLRDYKYGDPMGAALVIIEITKEIHRQGWNPAAKRWYAPATCNEKGID